MGAWAIIDRENTLLCAFVQGFRGLVVGDGDGLDFLGMKTDDKAVKKEEAHKFKAAFGTFGMIFFFSYLMNLIIAIFSNTYEKADRMVWLYFHRERARDLRDNILALHKFRLNGSFMKRMEKWGCDRLFFKPLVKPVGITVFAVGLVMQVGIHVMPEGLFVHKVVFHITTWVSILLLTMGALVIEGSVYAHHKIKSDWFPASGDELNEDHHMYVFCRSDFDENFFLGTEEMDVEMDDIHDKLRLLDEKIQALNEHLEGQ